MTIYQFKSYLKSAGEINNMLFGSGKAKDSSQTLGRVLSPEQMLSQAKGAGIKYPKKF